MNIKDQHLYHGDALMQIAEHEDFTAINRLDVLSTQSSSAFRINANIGVYLKYNSVKPKANGEFPFTFSQDNLKELADIEGQLKKVFLALVCVRAREVCIINLPKLREMIAIREKAAGGPEAQYVLLITARPNNKLRAYMNAPGTRGKLLKSTEIKVSRNDFPVALFAS